MQSHAWRSVVLYVNEMLFASIGYSSSAIVEPSAQATRHRIGDKI